MIKENELRIGNIVRHNDIPSSSEFPDTIFEWALAYWYDIETAHLSLASIDPIPLTPKILVDICGFKYGKVKGVTRFVDDINDIDPADKKRYTHYWDKDIKETKFVDSHHICIVKWGKEEYFTFQLERGFYRQKIKYLHQLQNLYFALTGEELPIDISKLKTEKI